MPAGAGPKRHKGDPFPLEDAPPIGADRCIWFIEQLRDRNGPIRLRAFQREIIRGLFPLEGDRPRVAYTQMPRQQGKSWLAGLVGLYATVADEAANPVVAIVANSERQAKELFLRAVEVYENTPALQECMVLFADRLEYRAGGTRLQIFASSPAGAMGGGGRQLRGLSCHLVINDEIAFTPDPRLWSSVLWPTILADPRGLVWALTTPGWDLTSPAYLLYQQARQGTGERFYSRIFEADPESPIEDENAWRIANPALEDGLQLEDLRIAFVNRSSDEAFRREHLGQWTALAASWLSAELWDACADSARTIPDETPIWLGFDGSWTRDSTALVAATSDRHVFVAGAWENPGRTDWRVPRDEVEAAVAKAFTRFSVQRMLCDPAYWESEIQAWAQRYGEKRVLEFPPTRARMGPASVAFHGAVAEGRMTHDGSELLRRHVLNAVTKPSPYGDLVTKASKDSPAKIDAAIAGILAFHAAVSAGERTPAIW